MAKVSSPEEKKPTTAKATSASKADSDTSELDTAAKPTRKKAKAAEESDDADETTTRKPRSAAASTRPSIYEAITNTAKKAEAERAAKAAARATAQASQKDQKSATSTSSTAKKASPFLATNIGKAIPSSAKVEAEASKAAAKSKTPTAEAPAPEIKEAAAPTAARTAEEPQASASAPPVTAEPKVEPKKEERAPAPVAPSAPARPAPEAPAPKKEATPQTGGTRKPSAPPARKPEPAKPASPPPQAKPAEKPQTQPARHGRQAPTPPPPKPAPVVPPVPTGPVALPAVMTVRDLAPLLNVPVGEMLKKLISMGIFATINQSLDYDTASLIAEELGIETKPAEAPEPKAEAKPLPRNGDAAEDKGKQQERPPIVTVLGHVDHGKTSLLDAIRNANVAGGEAGGITQHIGAYQIERAGRKITFLDTPGHEAFTAMRARGAQVTDVAVLVVAADDGVMPQTVEAINHARAANVPIVVALNKIDRETAEPQRVMRQLSENNVLVEEWGGDVPLVKVSAKQMTGIEELLDIILLVADLQENRANPDRPAIGTVIEAEVDRSRGPVATLLVQNGTLRQTDYLVINDIQGRIRAMFDDRGNRLSEAGPAMPVVVLGLPSVPQAGETFQVVADERTARNMAEQASDAAQAQARATRTMSLDDLYAQLEEGKVHDLNIVLKADVQGSLEPIRNSLEKLSTDQLKVRILHQGLGNISESDVSLALASNAIVIGFNVDPDAAAKRLATSEGVDIRVYSIIYALIEDVEKALKGLLEPTYKEVVSGRAEVRQVFKVNKKNVAGCMVREGKAVRNGQARLLRGGKALFDGRIASLKRFTEDAREVLTGFECGVMLEGFEDYKTGDVIEFYHKEKEE